MRTTLTALVAGLALFGLVGASRADALGSENIKALTLTDTWSLSDTQPATRTDTQVVTLSDAQMDNVTAGYWAYQGVRSISFLWRGRMWTFFDVQLYYWQ